MLDHNRRTEILAGIVIERRRQAFKFPLQEPGKCDEKDDNFMLTVLVEEVGEVARAIQEGRGRDEELIQVAAVAVKWLEMRRPSRG